MNTPNEFDRGLRTTDENGINPGTTFGVDPHQITFRQLKEMVGETGDRELPDAAELEGSDTPVLFKNTEDGNSVTVYRSGFFVFRQNHNKTVYAVDRIRNLKYSFADGSGAVVNEEDFADSCCLIPLYIVGNSRAEHNVERDEYYWQDFSLENNGNDWSAYDDSASPENLMIEAERNAVLQMRIDGIVSHLTKKQKTVFKLHYCRGMTVNAVSEYTGIPLNTVYRLLDTVRRDFHRNFENV